MAGTHPPSRARRGAKTHNPSSGSRSGKRRRSSWKRRLILASGAIVLGLFAWAAIARQLAPVSNSSLTRFDAIIVLGSPADRDGNPSPTQLGRVTEAVREYERGVAPRLILTGGVDRNRPVEAEVMGRTAEALGVPRSAIFEEGRARDTIENGCYSTRIMKSHGWRSAEVISSASHLPRAGLIFSYLPLEWRTHAAPSLEPESAFRSGVGTAVETLKTMRYLVWARQMERCAP